MTREQKIKAAKEMLESGSADQVEAAIEYLESCE